jgi:hypothetical protein
MGKPHVTRRIRTDDSARSSRRSKEQGQRDPPEDYRQTQPTLAIVATTSHKRARPTRSVGLI